MQANRQEARPLEFEQLTDTQKDSAERIAQSLLSALEDLEALPDPGDSPTSGIDRFRPAQIFFVSGEPGSGKTSLYLTLKAILKDSKKKIDGDCLALKDLKEKAQQLRWLEPLDLEPMAESANFLAAVLVRIEAEIEEKRPRRDLTPSHRPGLLEDMDALQKLRRLQSDIVLAWDGMVARRAEHVDPDVFAQEVLSAEKARLRVNHQLRKVLARLSGAKKAEERVLYILPVDDFYLNPASSLEFLRLLRMISVPHLFILVLGDIDVISELFFQNMLGHLVRLAGEGSLSAIPGQQANLTARAGALTSHAMRKLLPPSQRSVLEAMDRLQALDFRPERSGKENTLGDLLKVVSLDLETASPTNLSEFLLLQDREVEATAEFYTYSGLAILDLPPREVVDLWHSLAKLVEQKKGSKKDWEATLGVVVDQTLESLDQQSFLDLEARERCREAIQGRAYVKRTFQRNALRVEPRLGRDRLLSLHDSKVLTLFVPEGWIARPRWDESQNKHPKKASPGLRRSGEDRIDYLPQRPTAWLTVLHDLMAMSSGDRMKGDPLLKPYELGWVVVSDKQSARELSWLTPAWSSFRDFDVLAFRWRKVLEKMDLIPEEDPEELLSWLVYNWLDAVTEILLEKTWEPERTLPELKIEEEKWQALRDDTLALLEEVKSPGLKGRRDDVLQSWLLRLPLFLTSKFAIPGAPIEILRDKQLEDFWERERERIKAIEQAEVTPRDSSEKATSRDFSSATESPA